MFEDLSQNIQEAFRKLRGHGKLTEKDVDKALRDVRMALLSADVNYKIVRQFEKNVKARAIDTEILSKLTPAQSVIKIVDEELAVLMGGKAAKLNISSHPPTVILMVGLQGSGRKTRAVDEKAGQASGTRRGGYLPTGGDKTVASSRRTNRRSGFHRRRSRRG